MNTLGAFMMAESARAAGKDAKVFDWDKAARLIKERNATNASAGLSGDWEWTGGKIFTDGKPNTTDYTHLSSVWATPEIEIDGDYMDCWVYKKDSPGWHSGTKWPDSALRILEAGE